MKIWTSVQQQYKKFCLRCKAAWHGVRFPLYCKIHGVCKGDRQGAIAQSREGDVLQIVHVPTEEYPYNVYVYNITLNRVLGYLHEELCKKLVKVFGKQFCRDAIIENITGGAPMYALMGCNIRILTTSTFMKNYEDFSFLYEA